MKRTPFAAPNTAFVGFFAGVTFSCSVQHFPSKCTLVRFSAMFLVGLVVLRGACNVTRTHTAAV